MLIRANVSNPFDPNVKTNMVTAPIEFVVNNPFRSIRLHMGTWASVEALLAGYPPISRSEYVISGDEYFDMVGDNAASFIGIGDAIDAYLKNKDEFASATVIPTTLPEKPVVE